MIMGSWWPSFFLRSASMTSKEPIKAGETYWVKVEKAKFKVRAIRPSVIKGWWHCEGEETGDPLVIPEDKLKPVED